MSIFDKLKEFVKINFNLNIQIGVKTVNIITDPSSKLAEFNETDRSLKIFWNNIPEEKRLDFKPLLLDAVREQGALILEEGSKEILEDIELKEKAEDEQSLLSFFKNKIPSDDYVALRASLYLRKRFKEGAGKEEIAKLKTDIIKKYSRRGRNISDLCSAGYFETLMKLFEEMKKYPDFSDDSFLELYKLMVEEGTLTVFVSGGKSDAQVRKEIESKIKRNRQYGIHFLYIHGIGRTNIETIKMVIIDLKEIYSNLKIQGSESANIISIKLLF